MKRYKGGISIFLIIIVMASVILGGFFIDYSRILVAKNRVRTANESAVRSCLADYEKNLVNAYGLFGVTSKNLSSNYEKYINNNLITENSTGMGKILNFENIECNVSSSKPLSDDAVFEEKITEFQKYRAPVSITMGVVDKFKSIFGGDSSAVTSIDIEGTMDNVTKSAKDSFKNMTKKITTEIKSNIQNKVKDAISKVNKTGNQYNIISDEVVNGFVDSINAQIDEAYNQVNSYENSLKDYNEASNSLTNASDTIKENVNSGDSNSKDNLSDNINTEGLSDKTYKNNYDDENQREQNEANEAVEAAKNKYNNTISAAETAKTNISNIKAELAGKVDELKNAAGAYNVAAKAYNDAYDLLIKQASAKGFGEDMVNRVLSYDDAYLQKVKNEYDSRRNVADGLNGKAENIEKGIKDYNAAYEQLKDNLSKANNTMDTNTLKKKLEELYVYIGGVETNMNEIINSSALFPANNNVSGSGNSGITPFEFSSTDDGANEDIKKITDKIKSINDNYSKYIKAYNTISSWLDNSEKRLIGEFYYDGESYKGIKSVKEAEKDVIEKANAYKVEVDKFNVELYESTGVNNVDNYVKTMYKDAGVSEDENGEEEDFDTSGLENNRCKDEITKILSGLEATMPTGSSAEEKSTEGNVIKLFNNIYNYFKEMAELITNPEKIRDKMYLVDYIMNNCTFVTLQTERNHYFKKAEVEYIIFGRDNQLENALCAFGQVTIIRFAINAVNYWITTPGEFVTRTVSALTRGVAQTAKDMLTMIVYNDTDQGKIPLCPSLNKAKILTYSDHLRILLLLKMNDDGERGALRRCMYYTLKHNYNTEFPETDKLNGVVPNDKIMSDYATEVTGNVKADVDLYFVRMLMPDFVNFGSIHDGKYTVESSFTYGY